MSYLDMFGGTGPFGPGVRRPKPVMQPAQPARTYDYGTVGFDDSQIKPGVDYGRRAQIQLGDTQPVPDLQVGGIGMPAIPITGTGFTQPDPVTGQMPRPMRDNTRKDAIRAAGAVRRQARQAAQQVNNPARRGTVRPPAGGGRV